jgi:hypothetical protein
MKPTRSPDGAAESTLAWWRSPGLVYFLSVGEPTLAVKVGMLAAGSKGDLVAAVRRRLSQIQSSNHEHVQLLGAIPFTEGEYPTKAAEDIERELHLRFEHLCRFKPGSRGAEWFTADPELLEHIRSISKPPEALNLPRSVAEPVRRARGDV